MVQYNDLSEFVKRSNAVTAQHRCGD